MQQNKKKERERKEEKEKRRGRPYKCRCGWRLLYKTQMAACGCAMWMSTRDEGCWSKLGVM